MKRPNAAAAIASGAILAMAIAGTAGADTGLFPFHDCVGPAGTPTSFTAEKTKTPSAAAVPYAQTDAYRLTDGSAVFIALIRDDIHHPPGMDRSGNATTTCLVDTPIGTLPFWGFLTPAP